MKQEESHIKYYIIKLIMFAILAVCVFVFRYTFANQLRHFIALLMLIYGVEEIIFELIHAKKKFLYCSKVYLGFVEIIVAITIMIAIPSSSISFETICVVWAVWSILREAYEIKEIVIDLKSIAPRIISGVESLIMIGLSISLVLHPTLEHVMIHIYFLTVELLLSPLIPLMDELIIRKENS